MINSAGKDVPVLRTILDQEIERAYWWWTRTSRVKCSMERLTEVKTALATTVVVEGTSLSSAFGSCESVPSGFMRAVVMEGVAFCEPVGGKGCPFWRSAWRSAAISYKVLGFFDLRAIGRVFVKDRELRGRELRRSKARSWDEDLTRLRLMQPREQRRQRQGSSPHSKKRLEPSLSPSPSIHALHRSQWCSMPNVSLHLHCHSHRPDNTMALHRTHDADLFPPTPQQTHLPPHRPPGRRSHVLRANAARPNRSRGRKPRQNPLSK